MQHCLALQEFAPTEQPDEGCCIWCGSDNYRKNRAHILSQKLADATDSVPILKRSVCERCNTACGKIEDWILHYTPLGWVRHFLYPLGNRGSGASRIPAYFYESNLDEWIIHALDPTERQYTVPPQLLLTKNGVLKLLVQANPKEQPAITKSIFDALGHNSVIKDINVTLPHDFGPRALLEGKNLILIARNQSDACKFESAVKEHEQNAQSSGMLQLQSSGAKRQHFRWSKENWVKFCAKVSFESLCLFEGHEVCLRPCFSRLREYVLSGPTKKSREVIFSEHGPLHDQDVPQPVCVDLTLGQNSPENFPAMFSHADSGMHSVTIDEMEGWICASISFAGFPPSFLILGGPNEHLNDLYSLTYDEKECRFHFARLAFDPSKPIIQMPVLGNIYSGLVQTYRLRSI